MSSLDEPVFDNPSLPGEARGPASRGSSLGNPRTLLDVFLNGAVDPERLAVIDGRHRLTYGDLDRATARVAAQLRARGAGPGARIGMTLNRSAEAVVAIIAILRTGASYVPLDLDYPRDRLQFMVEDAAVRILVAGASDDLAGLPSAIPVVVVEATACVADLPGDTTDPGAGMPPIAPQPGDEAYVIYTSGTTGAPKGCSVSHANVVALLLAALPLFNVDRSDRWTMFHSCSFDFSVWELWGALATGATVVVVPRETAVDPQQFAALCVAHRVTVLCAVPSVFSGIARRLSVDSALRYVIFGGEAMRSQDVAHLWQGRLAGEAPRVINMYGITETTVHTTFKVVVPDDLKSPAHLSPIGRELPHLRVLVADEIGRPVPDGEDGEILVSGSGVCAGYVNRPELTAQRFVTIDGQRFYRSGDMGRRLPDGELAYRGRLDDQVKVRGFRIELGEVEAALRQISSVRDACAVVTESTTGSARLDAAIEADPDVDLSAVRSELATRVPAYMMPTRIAVVASIPLTTSGKADRGAMRRDLEQQPDQLSATPPPRPPNAELDPLANNRGLVTRLASVDPIVETVRQVWTDILGHSDFSLDDGFFDAGGDSLSVVSVLEGLHDRFPSSRLRLVDLLIHPSVNALSKHLEQEAADRAS